MRKFIFVFLFQGCQLQRFKQKFATEWYLTVINKNLKLIMTLVKYKETRLLSIISDLLFVKTRLQNRQSDRLVSSDDNVKTLS